MFNFDHEQTQYRNIMNEPFIKIGGDTLLLNFSAPGVVLGGHVWILAYDNSFSSDEIKILLDGEEAGRIQIKTMAKANYFNQGQLYSYLIQYDKYKQEIGIGYSLQFPIQRDILVYYYCNPQTIVPPYVNSNFNFIKQL